MRLIVYVLLALSVCAPISRADIDFPTCWPCNK